MFRARLLKLAELASFHIYNRRNDSNWEPPISDTNKLLKVILRIVLLGLFGILKNEYSYVLQKL